MKNCLILLTKTYPFDTGEEFIENELPITAQRFDRLLVIATSTSDHPVQTRVLPENAAARFIPASDVRRAVPAEAARQFLRLPGKYRSAEEQERIGRSPLRRLFLSYFSAKADRIACLAKEILKKENLEKYEGITFYSYWFFDTALAALILKKEFGAANGLAVSRAHRYDLYESRNRLHYLPLRPFLLKNLDAVYPCSDNGSRCLKEKFPRYSDKIHTAYLGTFDFGAGPGQPLPEFHLVSCCHISPVKRVERLAQALALLSGSGLKLKWTHFGGGSGLPDLQNYAKQNLGFMEYRFAGEIPNKKLMEFYQTNHVDCFVNTSSSEGLPVSIMEACSFGIPILATNVGGTSEIVRSGVNGFLLDADFTPDSLAEKIKSMNQMDRQDFQAMRTASREIWKKNFCAETNYARFAEAILPKN